MSKNYHILKRLKLYRNKLKSSKNIVQSKQSYAILVLDFRLFKKNDYFLHKNKKIMSFRININKLFSNNMFICFNLINNIIILFFGC